MRGPSRSPTGERAFRKLCSARQRARLYGTPRPPRCDRPPTEVVSKNSSESRQHFCNPLAQRARSSPCSHVAGARAAKNSFSRPTAKKKKSFHGSLAPALLLLPAGCGRRPRASVCSELVVVSSTPPPRFKASGAGRAPHVRAPGYFYLLPPQLQRSPFSEVAHASSAQGINENSSRGGELLRGGGGGTHVARLAHRGGADPAGAPGAGSESGVQFLAASPRKGGIQTWANVPRWRHPGSVTISWFSSSNCLFLE